MRILLVEDKNRLREAIEKALRESGYAVDSTDNGNDGLWMSCENTYDVILLDIMLPGLDGLSVLEQLRGRERDTPVLLLTAKDTIADRVKGLRKGADDYLIKPFALEELLARIEALCRRSYKKSTSTITLNDLIIDSSAKTVKRDGNLIDLTAREYAILEYLAMRQGSVISRSEIEEHIYDELVSPMSNVVDSAICNLRKKIAKEPDDDELIHTRRGQGYILMPKN
ncbi:MAG: response regulator transcription factor [Akkermansiaceae bacterium]|jgi:DNA-binding response OmpR family regulator|nr:response regulator transcription factor [Akkermansiaceae bacterium]MDG1854005.1 response regulator transcription factor [Verrucomicrobiales bacterium]